MCYICKFSKDGSEYNDYISELEKSFDFDSIGKSYKTKEGTMLEFIAIPVVEHKFRVISLYKYEPLPGKAPIIPTTRRFCAQLYLRTSGKNDYITHEELLSLNNPGRPYGATDILKVRGNYSADPKYDNCRHRFIRYKYDTKSGNIVRDPNQPGIGIISRHY